jgi:hypothetical protein
MQQKPKPARIQFLLVAAAFVVPLLLALVLYYSGYGQPSAQRSQHGVLLEPILHLPDVLGETDIVQLSGRRWMLVYVDSEDCQKNCRDTLYKQRQVRLMLGNEMTRVQRLFLHGESAPDKVFLKQQHAGLISIRNNTLEGLLDGKRPPESTVGGIYFIDPLGNLVMYFSPDTLPRDMLEDIKHLLELSRIG